MSERGATANEPILKVEIQRNETSIPLVYDKNIINAFTKGPMYCILFLNDDGERVSHKFPMISLFRVIETYPTSKRPRTDAS